MLCETMIVNFPKFYCVGCTSRGSSEMKYPVSGAKMLIVFGNNVPYTLNPKWKYICWRVFELFYHESCFTGLV